MADEALFSTKITVDTREAEASVESLVKEMDEASDRISMTEDEIDAMFATMLRFEQTGSIFQDIAETQQEIANEAERTSDAVEQTAESAERQAEAQAEATAEAERTAQAQAEVAQEIENVIDTAESATLEVPVEIEPPEEETEDIKSVSQLREELEKAEAELQRLRELESSSAEVGVQDQAYIDDLIEREAELSDIIDDIKAKINEIEGDSPVEIDVEAHVEEEAEEKTYDGKEKAGGYSPSIAKGAEKGAKGMDKMAKSVKKLVGGLAKALIAFVSIQKIISMTQDGLENLAQYSNRYNKGMSDVKSRLAELKNNLATMAEPIISAVLPAIARLIEMVSLAVEKVSMFTQALSGKSTFTKAKKQAIDYAKTVEKAQNNLAGFDDLNILSNDSSGGELTGANAFEEAEIDTSVLDFAQELIGKLTELKNTVVNWFSGIDFSPMVAGFQNILSAVLPLVETLGTGLGWVLENVLAPLGQWAMETLLPTVFNALAEAFSFVNTVLQTLAPALLYIYDNALKPIGSLVGELLVTVFEALGQAFSELSDTFQDKGEKITKILKFIVDLYQPMIIWVKSILQFVIGGIKTLLHYVVNIIGDVIDVFSGLVDFIAGVFTGDWERALNGIVDVGKGILNLLIDVFEGVVNTIINGINNISIDVPDWVPGIGGKTFGFNLEPLNIPRLANGGVTTGSTLANIGEAGREVVLPLERQTGWADILADAIVSRMGGMSNNVRLDIDGRTFARLQMPYLNGEASRIGTKLVVD